MSNDLEKQIIEGMRYKNKQCFILPEHDDLLLCLHGLSSMMTGRSDIMFCNSFISEAIQLLINSIFLYEDGNFDCSFYSIRQASEVANNMLYLSSAGKTKLNKWNSKNYFPMNAKLMEKLEIMDTNYTEVKTVLSDFFNEHNELIKTAHKIVHKQGFDSFYAIRTKYQYSGKFNKENETQFFLRLLKSCIGKVIILFIIIDPLSLVLADGDLSARCNFDPVTEAVDVKFFQEYLSGDIIEKIKNTSFFEDFSGWFTEKEKMTPAVFDVIRNNAFYIDSLDEIEKQKHLLSLYEKVILEILQAEIKLTYIYPDCSMLYYFTSIPSNFHTTEWHFNEYNKYLKSDEIFNQQYHNVFRSILKVFENNWILEHNEFLSNKEIESIKMIVKNHTEAYSKAMNNISW
ncbi:MAG: hypothetical protein XD78_1006 [Desulfotomaculum sp. 46_296]|nr:MAG: hypothetical protein XD78_1006 [Desulfotomaculum sp. 46_296]KUK84791.1 MAG: hypothetical protein XE00_0538 [Desulfofundulus kuznetsovii]